MFLSTSTQKLKLLPLNNTREALFRLCVCHRSINGHINICSRSRGVGFPQSQAEQKLRNTQFTFHAQDPYIFLITRHSLSRWSRKSLHGTGMDPTGCQIPASNHHSPHFSLPSATRCTYHRQQNTCFWVGRLVKNNVLNLNKTTQHLTVFLDASNNTPILYQSSLLHCTMTLALTPNSTQVWPYAITWMKTLSEPLLRTA